MKSSTAASLSTSDVKDVKMPNVALNGEFDDLILYSKIAKFLEDGEQGVPESHPFDQLAHDLKEAAQTNLELAWSLFDAKAHLDLGKKTLKLLAFLHKKNITAEPFSHALENDHPFKILTERLKYEMGHTYDPDTRDVPDATILLQIEKISVEEMKQHICEAIRANVYPAIEFLQLRSWIELKLFQMRDLKDSLPHLPEAAVSLITKGADILQPQWVSLTGNAKSTEYCNETGRWHEEFFSVYCVFAKMYKVLIDGVRRHSIDEIFASEVIRHYANYRNEIYLKSSKDPQFLAALYKKCYKTFVAYEVRRMKRLLDHASWTVGEKEKRQREFAELLYVVGEYHQGIDSLKAYVDTIEQLLKDLKEGTAVLVKPPVPKGNGDSKTSVAATRAHRFPPPAVQLSTATAAGAATATATAVSTSKSKK